MSYGNQYHGNQYIGPSLQERAVKPAVERDPDGLCSLLSQSVDRASALNESLAKLNQHMSAVLIPETPEPATEANVGGNLKAITSHAHDRLYTILARLEQAERQISSIAVRFKG